MNKEMFKEVTESGIDKFTTKFVVLEKDGEYDVRIFSEEFDDEEIFYEGIVESKQDGWKVSFKGYEEDVSASRNVSDFGEDFEEVFNEKYGEDRFSIIA